MPATRVYEDGERHRPKNATLEEVIRLHDHEGYSFAQIGRLWNVTKQRVHQLYEKALKKREAEANTRIAV